MANTFNTVKGAPGIVAKATAKMLADNLYFCKSVAQADESDYNGKNGYSAGDTIYISKPARFIAQQAFDITSTVQNITEEKVALVLDTISTVGLAIDSLEFATTIQLKSMLERVIKPAVQTIAHDVESRYLVKAYQATANSVGTPGAGTFDTDAILSAREKMNKFLAPKDDDRFFLHESTSGRLATGARKGLFQSSAEIAKQYKQGLVGQADGYNWLENELLPTHTNGTATGAHTVTTTVSAEGQLTLAITGTGTQTIKKGQILTVAAVQAVHPITKTVYPFLKQFVAAADATAIAGAYTVTLTEGFYTSASKGLQNIDAFPQSGAVITFVGTASQASIQNLAYHKNAFRIVSVPLVMPKAVEFAVQETYQGVTVSIIRAFDVNLRRMVTRMDYLGGFVADRPEFACRLPN